MLSFLFSSFREQELGVRKVELTFCSSQKVTPDVVLGVESRARIVCYEMVFSFLLEYWQLRMQESLSGSVTKCSLSFRK